MKYTSSLEQIYREKVIAKLQERLKEKNLNALPKLDKLVINTGIGKLLKGSKDYSSYAEVLTKITGQKPVVCLSKVAISNFSLRENMPVGLKVTLRGKRMWEFLTRLLMFGFPRVRDFKGLSPKAFDQQGNYSIGITEYTIFPEHVPEDLSKVFGFQIIVGVKSNVKENKNKVEHAKVLLEELGFPFKK